MQLTIFKRLTAGYLAIMVMVFVFGGYVAFQLNRLNRITHLAAVEDSTVIQTVEAMSTRLQILVSLEKKYWASGDRDFFALFQKRCNEFIDLLETLETVTTTSESRSLTQAATALSRSYLKGVEKLGAQEGVKPSPAYTTGRDELVSAVDDHLAQIYQSANRTRNERIQQSEAISANVLRVTIVLAAVCILLGLAVSFLTTKRIVRPIMLLQQKTRDLAAGRFVKIEGIASPPEIRHLADDFNAMSDRLKELDALKEDYVSHLSHNLRTPLTAIWEASQMLIDGTFDSDPENRSQLLTIVRDECKRLIVSVDQILDLSRMEGGMMDYRFEPIDLDVLVASTVARMSPIAQAKRIRLDVASQGHPLPAKGDPEQIQQLLGNLIDNALKFTDPGGHVTVNASIPNASGDAIRIAVSDNGRGIGPEYLETIFSKFRRIEEGKNTARGAGLGLAIAKHIVAAHGGDIWVESRKGIGSTFYFSLPSTGWL